MVMAEVRGTAGIVLQGQSLCQTDRGTAVSAVVLSVETTELHCWRHHPASGGDSFRGRLGRVGDREQGQINRHRKHEQ